MRLKKERLRAGLTQVELAALSGVSQSFISDLERGHVGDARSQTLEDLADALRRRGCVVEGRELAPSFKRRRVA